MANYATAKVSLCTPNNLAGYTYYDESWSIPVKNVSTIVRWISDSCADNNGLSEGYAQLYGTGHQIVLARYTPPPSRCESGSVPRRALFVVQVLLRDVEP